MKWMKRTVLLITMLVMLSCVTVSAAGSPVFSCSYVQKSAGSFYIDVKCNDNISAALFTLAFDGNTAVYQGIEAVNASSTLRDNPSDRKVAVCLADSGAVKDKLCRLRFKALAAGDARFTLHIEQAADENAKPVVCSQDDILTVNLSKQDVEAAAAADDASGGSASRTSRSKQSSSSRSANGRSFITTRDEADDEDDEDGVATAKTGGAFDKRSNHPWRYVAIGAAAVVLILLLVAIGIYLGKKQAAKNIPQAPDEPPTPPEERSAAEEEPLPAPAEKQALIEELNQEVK